ncbi:MAG: caspase family protein [Leptolyngbya sp.]|nr:caspase family protein [Candidatus Melainabacteria bacterium]
MNLSRYFAFAATVCFSLNSVVPAKADTPALGQGAAPSASTSTVSVTSSPAPAVNRPIRDKWALIVGCGKFGNTTVPSLKYASKDARDFYDYLIKDANFQPSHVRILLDEKATRKRVISELGTRFLARLARPDDLIVLFFSTHGSPSQMDLRGKNYLVTYDAEPEDLDATGIGMMEIMDRIHSRVLSDRVVMVLDACHSGSLDPNAKGLIRVGNFDSKSIADNSGQLVICSSLPDEQSWESKRYQNGVFTKSLIESLKAKSGKNNLGQAFTAAQLAVENEVREDRPGARQTPILNAKWSGHDIVLSVPAADPQKVPPTVLADLEPDSSSTPVAKISMVPSGSKMATAPVITALATPASAPSSASITSASLAATEKLVLTASYFSSEANPREALRGAYEASAANFNNVEFYWRKAKILIQMGKWTQAMECLKGCIVDDPNKSEYYLARALCYHHMKLNGLATADIQTAQFKNPTISRQIEFGE